MCSVGLIGGINVAGMRDHDDFASWDSLRDQLSVFRGHKLIGFAMHNEWGSRDLRYATVRFPHHDALQLSHVAIKRRNPLHANFQIFLDSRWRSSFVIDIRIDGPRGLFWSHALAREDFDDLWRGAFRFRASGSSAAQD